MQDSGYITINPTIAEFFHSFRGTEGDFKIMLGKSPLTPLCLSKDRKKITKEGYNKGDICIT